MALLELAESSDAAGRPRTGFSIDEMKVIAEEAGLERVLGAPLEYRLDAHFAKKLTEGSTVHLLSLVRAAIEKHGEGEGTRVRVRVDRHGALMRHTVFYGIPAFWTFSSALLRSPTSPGRGCWAPQWLEQE